MTDIHAAETPLPPLLDHVVAKICEHVPAQSGPKDWNLIEEYDPEENAVWLGFGRLEGDAVVETSPYIFVVQETKGIVGVAVNYTPLDGEMQCAFATILGTGSLENMGAVPLYNGDATEVMDQLSAKRPSAITIADAINLAYYGPEALG